MKAVLPPFWIGAFTVFWAACVSSLASESALTLSVDDGRDEAEVRFRGHRVMLYAFSKTQFKPYVRELCPLGGANILRDAPRDHPHHHGLMYAIRVNGVNFWEERGTPGHERHVRWLSCDTGADAEGRPAVTLVEQLHWIADKDKDLADSASAALLIETRTLRIGVEEKTGEVVVDWQGEFEVGAGAERVQLHGSEYNGLGMRMPESWDRVAVHENSTRLPFPNGGRRDVLPARWTSTTHGSDGGRETMLAFFGHEANAGGETRFFTELVPYCYVSATQGLNAAPIEHARGERWSVRYLLAVYSERKTPEFLDERWRQWNQISKEKR